MGRAGERYPLHFKLATKDPNGKKTSGITRTKTDETEFTADDGVKSKTTGGANAWPSSKYLNIWVCTLADQLLGYAQFPGGPAKTDGVVFLNTAFGTPARRPLRSTSDAP